VDLITAAIGTLWNLTFLDEAVDSVAENDKVPVLIQIMNTHALARTIIMGCCGVLMNLASHSGNRDKIIQFHGVSTLATAAENHADYGSIVELACQALYMIGHQPGGKQKITDGAHRAAAVAHQSSIKSIRR